MSVVVACKACGSKFRAKEEHAGRRVKCPKCGNVLEVPTPIQMEAAATDDAYGIQASQAEERTFEQRPAAAAQPAGPVCAACRKPRAEEALICIHCGLDFRTGNKLSTTIGPKTFGKYSISRGLNGELMLSVAEPGFLRKRRRSFDLSGYEMVYYDTMDSPGRAAAGKAAGIAGSLAIFVGALALGWIVIPNMQSDDQQFGFEVGLAGENCVPIPLHRSQKSAEVREIATWLSEATGLPIQRSDRRTY